MHVVNDVKQKGGGNNLNEADLGKVQAVIFQPDKSAHAGSFLSGKGPYGIAEDASRILNDNYPRIGTFNVCTYFHAPLTPPPPPFHSVLHILT